jgi:regulator of protease activity HflC (stomatin/prohibitin superfamily)
LPVFLQTTHFIKQLLPKTVKNVIVKKPTLFQDLSVTYQIIPDWPAKIFSNFKGAKIEVIEDSFIRRSIITACDTKAGSQFTILEAYGEKKPIFEKKITEELDKLLQVQGFKVVTVNLGEGYLESASVKRAIEAPLKAQAASKEAEAQLALKQAQAQQKIITAEAEAKARIIRAESIKKEQELTTSSLTPAILEKMRIEKFNPNVQVIYIPADTKILTGLPGKR